MSDPSGENPKFLCIFEKYRKNPYRDEGTDIDVWSDTERLTFGTDLEEPGGSPTIYREDVPELIIALQNWVNKK